MGLGLGFVLREGEVRMVGMGMEPGKRGGVKQVRSWIGYLDLESTSWAFRDHPGPS